MGYERRETAAFQVSPAIPAMTTMQNRALFPLRYHPKVLQHSILLYVKASLGVRISGSWPRPGRRTPYSGIPILTSLRIAAGTRLSPKPLRIQAEKRLLVPPWVDPATGFWYAQEVSGHDRRVQMAIAFATEEPVFHFLGDGSSVLCSLRAQNRFPLFEGMLYSPAP